ncbi:MAG: hypothetical protein ABJN22_08350 [Litorimonas sp.]
MTKSRGLAFTFALTCAFASAACTKAEPDLPTFDPLDKIQQSEGWKVGRSIAVSPGAKTPTAHHVQALTSGLHDVDLETPPIALTAVEPSCQVRNPGMGGGKYLIIGSGSARFPLMKQPDFPGLMTFENDEVNKLGKAQAETMKSKGMRSTSAMGDVRLPAQNMPMTDVFITETSETVFVALAGDGLFNFNMSPNVRLSGVVVYSEKGQAAVLGVPDHVPVNFVSKTHKSTRGCWTRVQPRPDASWPKRMQKGPRFDALKPHWKTFERRVRKDIGTVPAENVISVNRADHFLIGPAPTRYEDRLPYAAYAGKSVRFLAADHARFGLSEDNKDYARQILDQYYEAHLAAGK